MTIWPNPKVPLEPLVRALVACGAVEPDKVTNAYLADVLGIAHQSVTRIVRKGELTVWAADRAAIRGLNVHPTYIWGDEWLDAIDEADIDRSVRIDLAFASLREVAS